MSRANQITGVRAVGALVCAGLVVGQLAGSVARPSWWLAAVVGAARYLNVAGGWVRPRWQAPLRPRRSRKVIGARVATLMRTSVVPGLPAPLREVCIVGSTALLAWSFGRDIADQEGLTRRDTTPVPPTPIPREVPRALP
jgi:hypothetical protein